MTECSRKAGVSASRRSRTPLSLSSLSRRRILASFNGGYLTSDGSALWLREVDQQRHPRRRLSGLRRLLARHADSAHRATVASHTRVSSLSFAPHGRHHLRPEPSAVTLLAGICAGGCPKRHPLPRLLLTNARRRCHSGHNYFAHASRVLLFTIGRHRRHERG